MAYICYKLDERARINLMTLFPPKYPQIRYDHITISLVGQKSEKPSPARSVEVIGIADDGNGIETLIVRINGSIRRPDGNIWHITASFDPEKKAPASFDISTNDKKEKPYRPVTSNGFLKQIINEDNKINAQLNPKWSVFLLKEPIKVDTYPMIQYSSAEIQKRQTKIPTL